MQSNSLGRLYYLVFLLAAQPEREVLEPRDLMIHQPVSHLTRRGRHPLQSLTLYCFAFIFLSSTLINHRKVSRGKRLAEGIARFML